MKKTVRVTITKEIEIDIPDERLTDEALEGFSFYMFHVDSVEELFEHAGRYVARFNDSNVEGVGRVGVVELFEDVETEVLS